MNTNDTESPERYENDFEADEEVETEIDSKYDNTREEVNESHENPVKQIAQSDNSLNTFGVENSPMLLTPVKPLPSNSFTPDSSLSQLCVSPEKIHATSYTESIILTPNSDFGNALVPSPFTKQPIALLDMEKGKDMKTVPLLDSLKDEEGGEKEKFEEGKAGSIEKAGDVDDDDADDSDEQDNSIAMEAARLAEELKETVNFLSQNSVTTGLGLSTPLISTTSPQPENVTAASTLEQPTLSASPMAPSPVPTQDANNFSIDLSTSMFGLRGSEQTKQAMDSNVEMLHNTQIATPSFVAPNTLSNGMGTPYGAPASDTIISSHLGTYPPSSSFNVGLNMFCATTAVGDSFSSLSQSKAIPVFNANTTQDERDSDAQGNDDEQEEAYSNGNDDEGDY